MNPYEIPHDTSPPVSTHKPLAIPTHQASIRAAITRQCHIQAVETALKRILSTELAETMFAQILDGLPTIESLAEFETIHPEHPVLTLANDRIGPGAVEQFRTYRDEFETSSLQFPVTLLEAYEKTTLNTKSFHLRLLEVLAVACHQIAVFLYNLDAGAHKHAEYDSWRPQRQVAHVPSRAPTPFCHNSYLAISQYPDGPADCVGYWAEAKIFGGVVVFDRGESETECRDVYIHGSRISDPETIYALTKDQSDRLILFLTNPDEALAMDSCPLPIHATFLNRYRWDPWDAIGLFHIFRDKYERKVPSTKPTGNHRERATYNYPECGDDLSLLHDHYRESQGMPVDHEEMEIKRRRLRQITPSSPIWIGAKVWRGIDEQEKAVVDRGYQHAFHASSVILEDL